jgi:diguanylate cyclase (GGDEF)-like protein
MAGASLALAAHDGPEAMHLVQQMERLRDTMVHREELAWRLIGAAAMRSAGRLLEAERWATAALALSLDEDGFRAADVLRMRAAIRWELGDQNLAFADSMDAIESMASTRADRIIVLAAGLADKAMLERARQQLTDQSASLAITAARDPLSGLANRRGLDEVVGLLARSDQSAVVVVVDIDHFKAVNDTFGHDVGDGVIRACADVLREGVGRASLIARLGGDEFVVVIVDGKTKPVPLGEHLCEAVRTRDWQALAPGLAVTVSVGVTVGAAKHLRDLIAHADMAMYQAKQGGRDGMEFAERRRGRARG